MSRPAVLCAILVAAALALVGCDKAPYLASIQVLPTGASLTTVGETVQFKAIGTYETAGGRATTSDITSQVTWTSSEVGVSTISSTGLATAVSQGTTSITAVMASVQGSTNLNVSALAAHGLTSIAIIPSSQAVTKVGEPTQFIAIGTYNTAPITADLTDQVTWESSDVDVATINIAGLALGNATGTTTITAIDTPNGGATITGTATLTVTASGGLTLPLLEVYEVGLGKGNVTSSPVGLTCAPGSLSPPAACTGNFVLGQAVVLTASPGAGSTFGGWSANCTPDTATSCTVIMNNNEPVGAIFN